MMLGIAMTAGFILFFAVLWFGICAIIRKVSGWSDLESAFPDHSEANLIKRFRFASARFGHKVAGMNYSHCLTFDVCDTGLRVTLMKILGPTSKPFFVPWGQLSAHNSEALVIPHHRFDFGRPPVRSAHLFTPTAKKIADASQGKLHFP